MTETIHGHDADMVRAQVRAMLARKDRLLELAARPNCSSARRRKLHRKARRIMDDLGASGR